MKEISHQPLPEVKKSPQATGRLEIPDDINDEYLHTVPFISEGSIVARVEMVYKTYPFPYYYINDITVDQKNQGYGREIVQQLNQLLESKNVAGLLTNGIARSSPAQGMYEKYGWKPIPTRANFLTYNIPPDATPADIQELLTSLI